jgi:hypothetical protein
MLTAQKMRRKVPLACSALQSFRDQLLDYR